MKRISNSRLCLYLIAATYLVTLTVYDQLIFELTQEYTNWRNTRENLEHAPSARKLFTFDKNEVPRDRNGERKRVILLWRPRFGGLYHSPNLCDNCHLTYDQSSVAEADAVVFHCAETSDMRERYPWQQRVPNQRWVWMCREPPWMLRYLYEKKLTSMSGVFNWTMTYRTDSDIFHSYITDTSTISRTHLENMLKGKTATSLVSWVVSNCRNKKRLALVDELKKHVSIDVFGKCVDNRIAFICNVVAGYKFYLAFENSECHDYITEKFWRNALLCGAVPIVMGPPRREYEAMAPPNSFIHIDDFESLKELAEYLKMLDRDDEKYRKYMEWRLDGAWKEERRELLPGYGADGMCQLCDKLHQVSDKEKDIVENLDQWWYGNGYDPGDTHLPICNVNSGNSGYSHHWLITLIYSIGFAVVALVTWCVAQRPCRRRVCFCRNS